MTIAIVDVSGIGPKTAEYLAKQGITTAEALLEAGLAVLAVSPGFGDARARKSMDSAAALVVGAEEAESPVKGGGKADNIKGMKSKKDKKGKKGKKKKSKEGGKRKKSAKRKSGEKKQKEDGRKKKNKKNKKGKK